MAGTGAPTRPDKIHKDFDSLSDLQSHISGAGGKYEWGSQFTVTQDGTSTNNGTYELVYNLADIDKTNTANLKKIRDLGEEVKTYTFTNGLAEASETVSLGGTLNNAADTTISVPNTASRTFTLGTHNSTGFVSIGTGATSTQGWVQLGSYVDGFASGFFLTFDHDAALGTAGAYFTDARVTTRGIEYVSNYFAGYGDRTLPDWGIVKAYLGGKALDATVTNPGAGQNGFIISWNNTNSEYELVNGSTKFWSLNANSTIDTTAGQLLYQESGGNGYVLLTGNGLEGLSIGSTSIGIGDDVGNTGLTFLKGVGVDSMQFLDARATAYGVTYAGNYGATYNDRSLADWGNVKSQLGGKSLDTTVTTPGAGQNGYVLAWNNTNSEYELVAKSSAASNEIPKYDGTNLVSSELEMASVATLNLGLSSSTGTGRTIIAKGSELHISLQLQSKGSNGELTLKSDSDVAIRNTTNAERLQIDHNTSDHVIASYIDSSGKSFIFAASAGNATVNNGQKAIVRGGGAQVSTNGNGGDVALQVGAGQGTGTDGSISMLDATGSFGGGEKVIFIANATTAPTSNPTGGGILYVEAGALKYRGSSGTTTTIANA